MLVIGLFVLGGVVLAGLFATPRKRVSPPAPRDAAFGVPPRELRFVSYNILHGRRGLGNVVAEIRALAPDFVLLQEVESRHVIELTGALGMKQHHHPNLYQRSANLDGPKATWGNLILSKHPIFDAASIPNPGGGSFGVWAVAVVDGKKFVVANVHLSPTSNANPIHIEQSGQNRYMELTTLAQAWRDRGSPPIVVGGDFNQIPMGNNWHVMTGTWTDALGALGKDDITFGDGLLRTRIDYFFVSNEWRPVQGGVGEKGASDHRPIWLDATATTSAATTTRHRQ